MTIPRRLVAAILAAPILMAPGGGGAHDERQLQSEIAFEQNIGTRLPADLTLRDRQGAAVRLGDLATGRPTILALAWYSCTNLCPLTLRNLGRTLGEVPFEAGTDYAVVTASIDPRDGPALARKIHAGILEEYGRAAASGIHALTGQAPAIEALAKAVGFRFVYDEDGDRYGHPAGLVVLDPEGRVARYLFGVNFDAGDLRLALLEAGRGELGSPIDQIVLRCYAFDPETGRYSLAIMDVLRAAGLGSVMLLAGAVALYLRRERRRRGAGRGEP